MLVISKYLIPLAALSLCFAGAARAGEGVSISNVPVSEHRAGNVEVIGLDRLSLNRPWFGGWSGMAWDGDDLVVVSDMGHWARFNAHLEDNGRVRSLVLSAEGIVPGTEDGKRDADSEELLRTRQGWLVSFERNHRVLGYDGDFEKAGEIMEIPEEATSLTENGGIEAMTLLPDKRLLLVAEGEEGAERSPAWIGLPGQWRKTVYPHTGLFRPTGSATSPDGNVWMTERRYTLLGGAALRLVVLKADDLGRGRLTPLEKAVFEPPFPVDNFESIAFRVRKDGRTVAYIMSDDNFNPLQSTLLLTILPD